MVRRSPHPQTFSATMHEVWRRANEQWPVPLQIPCGDKSQAINLRHRLYSLRKSLISYGYSLGRDIQKFKIQIMYSETQEKFYLMVGNPDDPLDQILRNAGFAPQDAPSLASLQAEVEAESQPKENPYLKELNDLEEGAK